MPSLQGSKGNANRQAMGKGKKQQIGFRTDSLQSSGSGLIGTGRTSPGERIAFGLILLVEAPDPFLHFLWA